MSGSPESLGSKARTLRRRGRRGLVRLARSVEASSATGARAVGLARRLRAQPPGAPTVRDAERRDAAIDAMLPPGLRTVAVLCDPDLSPSALRDWLNRVGAERAHVFSSAPDIGWAAPDVTLHPGASPNRVHRALAELPPVNVIVDLMSPDRDLNARWRTCFPHLPEGGCYLIAKPDAAGDTPDDGVRGLLSIMAAGPRTSPSARPGISADLLGSVRDLVFSDGAAAVTTRHAHYLKVRDADADKVLRAREPNLTVARLATLPAGSFQGRDRVEHHTSGQPVDWPSPRVEYPELHLRHYTGRIGYGSNTLAYADRTILPECFRWHLVGNPTNPATINSTSSFARIPADRLPTTSLPGSYYQLDPQHGGFGHIMTETVGRLWGWDRAKKEIPDLKAVFSVKWPKEAKDSPKFKLLRAFGIAEDDIVWTDRPVWMDSLVGATAMWHNNVPYYVHPQIVDVWDRLRAGMVDPAAPTYDKVFISRGPKYRRRSCRNAEAVEQVFREYGFEIVYPEDLSLGAQAAVYADARILAGFGGSGLFNILYAQKLEVGIFLNQDSYYHRNEHLFTSLLGGSIHYFWSPADIPQDSSGHGLAASESAWDFDFVAHGDALRGLLASV